MPRLDSTLTTLIIAVALAVGVGYGVNEWTESRKREQQGLMVTTSVAAPQPARSEWVASAPGRVEPRDGEVRIAAQSAGRVVDVLARPNDRVRAGDLLVRLDDEEARMRLIAAEAEVTIRRRDRDADVVVKPALDRRAAEDAVAAAERMLHAARIDFDRAQISFRQTTASTDDVERARSALTVAAEKLQQEREELRRVSTVAGMPMHTRPEAALLAARAELALAELAFERTRIRAPFDGTILQVGVKKGEIATPSPETVAVVMGDVSALRVRAEVEERDVSKIRTGQRVVVRSDAYPGRDFEGRVARVAEYVGPPRLASRGPRKPTDVDILEVMIDVDGQPPLLPGMRTDVFFRADSTVQNGRPANAMR